MSFKMMDLYISLILFCGLARISKGEPRLLFANRKDIRIVNVTDRDPYESVVVEDLDDAAAVTFHYRMGYVFWTEINIEEIHRAVIGRVQETKVGIVTTGLVSPDGLACDWVGNKLYWSDSENVRIEVSNLDGSDRKTLYWHDLGRPRAIALNPNDGFMYWTDWGEFPKIERAGMDGTLSTRTVIVDDNISWPNGLTIDYDEEKIYWTDAKLSYIHKCNYDGSSREVVISKYLSHPYALTLFKEKLFWTDWQTKAIHTCNKFTGQDYKIILKNIFSPMDIQVFDAERQVDVPHPCDTDNGGCSHLCLLSPIPPNFKCACPTGVRLLDDQKTCADGFEEMLLVARRTGLTLISLDTPDFTQIDLQLKDIKHAIAIDYDPVDGYVYWTDDSVRSISRAFLNGTGQEVIVDTEVDNPDGIALDIVGRNMYWTDTGTDRIEVSRLDGSSRKILISENLDEPRGISLDTKRGFMWWTDWGGKPKIEKAYLDGTHRQVVINKHLEWPNSIVVDGPENKFYWCDAKRDTIEVANLDGSNRVSLVRGLHHVFGLSLLGDSLYWTDWQTRLIESVDKRTGKHRAVLSNQTPDLMGIKAVSSNRPKEWNPCADYNGGCYHLCLYTPEGPQCACPGELDMGNTGRKCINHWPLLYISEGKLNRLSLATSHKLSPTRLKGLEDATCLDFDVRDNKIYWVDGHVPSINRAFLNGSSIEKIVEVGIIQSSRIAVDWLSRNIYWTTQTRIEVAKLNGSSRKVLVWKDLNHLKDLTVDPPNGYMYWTDWSKRPKLERAWLDGTHREVLLDEKKLMYGLTIDYVEKRLYWIDQTHQRLESSDMQGGNHTIIVDTDIRKTVGLTQYEDFLYWIDQKNMIIERADKTTGRNRTLVHEDVAIGMDLLAFHPSRQSGSNGCVGNKGQCSHLCLALPDGPNKTEQFKCACPTHHFSSDDGKSCTSPNSFLLYCQKTNIKRLVVYDNDSERGPDVDLPINRLRSLKALEYDPVEGYVYWISGKSKAIHKSKMNGTDNRDVTKTTGIRPFDLAIDPFSRVLFYTCEQNNVINFTRIDEKMEGVVVQGEGLKPRYLALNPQTGHMFWTNECVIRRTLYDGTDAVDVIRFGLFKPGPITVDPVMRKIFWSSPENGMIECADLNGGNRKRLFSGKINGNIRTISGLSVMGEYLYWADGKKGLIGRINKNSGRNLTFVQGRVPNLSGIHAVVHLDPTDIKQHPCSKDNGNCSHLCFTKIENSAQCSCSNNFVLKSDERSCAEKITCTPGQFPCKSGDIQCIPMQWYCDGVPECLDNSDEEDCTHCGGDEYMCRDGTCIPKLQVCDGTFQCADGDDEDTCWRKESHATSRDDKKYTNSGKWWSTWPIRPFLLYSQKTEISRLVVHDYDSIVAPDVVLPIQLGNPKALDFDLTEGYIYWINGKNKTIGRGKMDGTEVQTIVTKPGIRPYDIAYDIFSRVLFYSCQRKNVINFVRDQEKKEGTVIQCAEPRYLALYSPEGYIFWTDKNAIRRALFDGTESVDIYSSSSSRLGPITIDQRAQMIYWTDLEHNFIESGNLFGGNRKLLLNGKSNRIIQSIVGIAVLDNYLYWADSHKQLIGRIDKTSGKNVTFVQSRLANLSGIQKAVSLDPWYVKEHPCSKDNGNCTHLCFVERKNGVRCSCPNDLILLSDGKTCSAAHDLWG